MTGLTDQYPDSHDPQVVAFALGMSASRQRSGRRRRDMGVEVRRVERQHIGRQFEALDRCPGECNLRRFQSLVRYALGNAMECLAGKLRGTQTRHSRQAVLEELCEVALGACRAHSLKCHGKHHLAHRRPTLGNVPYACSVDVSDQIDLLRYPEQGPHVSHRLRSYRTCFPQVCLRGWVCGSQDHLPCNRPFLHGIPYRLSHHPVPAVPHVALEEMHFPSCIA